MVSTVVVMVMLRIDQRRMRLVPSNTHRTQACGGRSWTRAAAARVTGLSGEPEGSQRNQGVALRSGGALIILPKGLSGERESSKLMSRRPSWVALKRFRPMWRELVFLVRYASFAAQNFQNFSQLPRESCAP
jgi:hypothetical protein